MNIPGIYDKKRKNTRKYFGRIRIRIRESAAGNWRSSSGSEQRKDDDDDDDVQKRRSQTFRYLLYTFAYDTATAAGAIRKRHDVSEGHRQRLAGLRSGLQV